MISSLLLSHKRRLTLKPKSWASQCLWCLMAPQSLERQWLLLLDYSFAITQCLICLQLLTKRMTGEEIVRELINTLSAEYGISSSHILGCMHDRAACNVIALRTLKIVFPALVDVVCFSHTLDLVGDKFCTPVLSSFIIWWISLFSHSPKSVLLRKERTGQPY